MRLHAVRIGTVTAGALLALIVTTGPASAHTSLKEASPAIGSTVSPPRQILLTFTDPVAFPQVVLMDSAGGRHESGKAQAVGNKVTEQVSGTLASGVYTVGWRVVAPDGHPVEGKYTFTVKGTSSAAASGSSGSPGSGAAPSPATSATPRTAGKSSSTGWWWIGLAALLGVGLIAGIAFVRKIMSP